MKNNFKYLIFVSLASPLFVFGQTGIIGYIDAAQRIVDRILIPLAFSLCVLYFFWGLAMYIRAMSRGEKSADGKEIMLRGIIGLFIATTIWGIIIFLRTELQIDNIQNVEKGDIEVVDTNVNYNF